MYVKYKPVIYKDGSFHKVKPYIIRVTNLGQIPQQALVNDDNEPYLTNDKNYFITTNSKVTTGTSSEDYILYEMVSYKTHIYKISSGDTPTESGFITSDNYILITANDEYFISAGG